MGQRRDTGSGQSKPGQGKANRTKKKRGHRSKGGIQGRGKANRHNGEQMSLFAAAVEIHSFELHCTKKLTRKTPPPI